MAIGISPALPFSYDQLDGPGRLTKTIKEAITQNFKHLILTNPGEKIMDPDFGVGIRKFLFELDNLGVREEISTKIRQQVKKYIKSITILDIRYTPGSSYEGDLISIEDSNSIYIHILFNISTLSGNNVLSVPISN
jgi:phage baseplate assembly protein W